MRDVVDVLVDVYLVPARVGMLPDASACFPALAPAHVLVDARCSCQALFLYSNELGS